MEKNGNDAFNYKNVKKLNSNAFIYSIEVFLNFQYTLPSLKS